MFKDVNWSYPFRDRYRDIFERHVDLPYDVFDFTRPKKLHANKLGRKKYRNHFFDGEGRITGDESQLSLENGLIFVVRRSFKKSLKSQDYLDLSRQSQSGAIRGYIQCYDVIMPEWQTYPEDIRAAMQDVFDRIFPVAKRLLAIEPWKFTTEKVSALNLFLRTINDLSEWDGHTEIPIDHRLEGVPTYQLAGIPWIRRRDKKFEPEYVEINDVRHVSAERRFFLIDNSIAIRIRKRFERPLHTEEYKEYKQNHRKTLLQKREDKQNMPSLLSDVTAPLDLLECVGEIQYFPAFLVGPAKAESFDPAQWPHPYIGRGIMRDVDRETEGETNIVLSRDFETSAGEKYFSTRDSLGLSLAIKALGALPGHKLSLAQTEFYKMAENARMMVAEEHDRASFDLY